ncbi:ABC transporter ATP-binding protein [Pararobbsia silviterrae]|uniref:ABC transporter ATP-binding protein n=1 Tax=Pararobbsia silviterrae TaxID=1792498 RepID=A0A494XGH0_9BURK|nr:ABC transporter ATP-binding protein [Pararobbsia silviterrae]
MLDVEDLVVHYGDFQALFGIDFTLAEGEVVALVGANGAGKSTFFNALAGWLPPTSGRIRLAGESIARVSAAHIVARGLSMVPEGRRLFPSLSVEENLRIGAESRRKGPWTLERLYALFPVLETLRKRPATLLSGGQQQMVAIGRALMSNPRVMLCDEVSLGLAPRVVRDIYAALPGIRREGTTMVVVEQDIGQAMKVADRLVCFQEGRVTLSGTPAELTRDQISAAYFGV